jgi:hypothetical protein
MLGFIVSNGWLRLDSFEALRRFLLDGTTIHTVVDFTGNVFQRAAVKAAIVVLSNGLSDDNHIDTAVTPPAIDLARLHYSRLQQNSLRSTYKNIFDLSKNPLDDAIKQQICERSVRLGDRFDLSFGLKTGDDSRFLTRHPDTPQHKPLLRGEDVHRYQTQFTGEYVWYVPKEMTAHRRTARPGTAERFQQPKVLIRDTGDGLQGTFDPCEFFVKDVLIVADKDRDANLLKLLSAILNSRLMRFFYETSFPTLHVQRDELASLPIRLPDASIADERPFITWLPELVDRMLGLQEQLTAARTAHDKTVIQRQIEATDRQIDRLVYELYGLTDDEIAIIEQRTPAAAR